jgi:hypothetical protein
VVGTLFNWLRKIIISGHIICIVSRIQCAIAACKSLEMMSLDSCDVLEWHLYNFR